MPDNLFKPLKNIPNNDNKNNKNTPKNSSMVTLLATIGPTRPTDPKTNKILNMLDPIIFPRDMPTAFFDKASKVTNISGNDVPIAITVMPTAFSENPNSLTSGAAPLLTNKSELAYKTILPATNFMIDLKKLNSFSLTNSSLQEVISGLKKLPMI